MNKTQKEIKRVRDYLEKGLRVFDRIEDVSIREKNYRALSEYAFKKLDALQEK